VPRPMNLLTPRTGLLAAASALVLAAPGCGSKTDVSAGTADFNKELAPDAMLQCPKEVSGGEGTVFDCTMKGTKSGKAVQVKLKVVKQNGDLAVDVADKQAFDLARQQVSGG
jgi:hypothetical protein